VAKPLGKTTTAILESLVEHGVWYPACGWVWTNRSTTERALDVLVRRGLAVKCRTSWGSEYRPTADGDTAAVAACPSLRRFVEGGRRG
jgi:hypothetical protein